MEVVLLLIVAAGIIALICITKKRKALEEGPAVIPREPDTESTSVITETIKKPTEAKKPEEKKTSDPAQIVICSFVSASKKRRCPFCDGENRAGVVVCNICGQDF